MARSSTGLFATFFKLPQPKLGFPTAEFRRGDPSVASTTAGRVLCSSSRPHQDRPPTDATSSSSDVEGDDDLQTRNEEDDGGGEKGGVNKETGEIGGPRGPEPTRYGDWERNGRCSDF